MVGFDLSEILVQSGLSVSTNQIQKLMYQLSTQTTGYLSNLPNLRNGKKPGEGQFIQSSDAISNFVANALLDVQQNADMYLAKMYSDQAYQVMLASGFIPVGWIQKNYSEKAPAMLRVYKNLWDAMLTDYAGLAIRKDFIYTKFKSFGMFTCKVNGHEQEKLMYFLIPANSIDSDFLKSWILENAIHEVVVLSEQEYATFLMNPDYTFLFKFDKIVDMYKGTTFRVNTQLKAAIPTFMVSIGCDTMCFFVSKEDSDEYAVHTNRYMVKDIQRGEVLQFAVSVPSNHLIDFVSINGVPHFFGTADMEANGISITESDKGLFDSYRTFNVSIAGIREVTNIYVDACEDMTGKTTTKNMISTTKSMVEISDEDVKVSLVFNNPFIFFNEEKLKIYARKDENSPEEIITNRDVIYNGYTLVQRKSTFGDTHFINVADGNKNNAMYFNRGPVRPHLGDPPAGSPAYDYPHPDMERRDNPFVFHFLPNPVRQPSKTIIQDATPDARVLLFNVTECGNIIITFDGYTDYKYFRITFDDRAMVTVMKIAGHMDDLDVIPVIEDFTFTNNKVKEVNDEGEGSGSGDGQSGSGSTGDDTDTGAGETDLSGGETQQEEGGSTETPKTDEGGSGNDEPGDDEGDEIIKDEVTNNATVTDVSVVKRSESDGGGILFVASIDGVLGVDTDINWNITFDGVEVASVTTEPSIELNPIQTTQYNNAKVVTVIVSFDDYESEAFTVKDESDI